MEKNGQNQTERWGRWSGSRTTTPQLGSLSLFLFFSFSLAIGERERNKLHLDARMAPIDREHVCLYFLLFSYYIIHLLRSITLCHDDWSHSDSLAHTHVRSLHYFQCGHHLGPRFFSFCKSSSESSLNVENGSPTGYCTFVFLPSFHSAVPLLGSPPSFFVVCCCCIPETSVLGSVRVVAVSVLDVGLSMSVLVAATSISTNSISLKDAPKTMSRWFLPGCMVVR